MDDDSKLELEQYLDNAIRKWRTKLNESANDKESSVFTSMESTDELIAKCYIDAFQSVRVSMLGELLPPEKS